MLKFIVFKLICQTNWMEETISKPIIITYKTKPTNSSQSGTIQTLPNPS